MKTRMTELLGIKHPIMIAGMSFVADDPKLVAAVSNAGGLGLLATAQFTPERTREAVKEVRALTDKPFGANVTLQFAYARENAEVCIEEKVPALNWSLGKADWLIKAVHEYGGKALGTVVMTKHALRAEQDGADAIIVTGHEAAAHGGDVTSMVLIPALASRVKIPVIAAGVMPGQRDLHPAPTVEDDVGDAHLVVRVPGHRLPDGEPPLAFRVAELQVDPAPAAVAPHP